MEDTSIYKVIWTFIGILIIGSTKSCIKENYNPNNRNYQLPQPSSAYGPCGAQPCPDSFQPRRSW
jgi:hypothetical protein